MYRSASPAGNSSGYIYRRRVPNEKMLISNADEDEQDVYQGLSYIMTPNTYSVPNLSTLQHLNNHIWSLVAMHAYKNNRPSHHINVIGQGSYGVAVKLPMNLEVSRMLVSMLRSMHNVRYSDFPSDAKAIVLKFEVLNGTKYEFFNRVLRESQIHQYLFEACAPSPCNINKMTAKWCGKTVVPAFYFSGLLAPSATHVTCMGVAPGESVSSFRRSHKGLLPLAAFRAIEKAVSVMYHLGVIHGDLHDANIFITKAPPYKATIIDFGLAMRIPPHKKHFVAKKLGEGNVDGAWYDPEMGLQHNANRIMANRLYTAYNPDGKMMRLLYQAVTRNVKLYCKPKPTKKKRKILKNSARSFGTSSKKRKNL